MEQTNELKTLKDFDDMGEIILSIKNLKAEAIKWIKRMSNYEALAWKKFFNITEEEDLKEKEK